jgi:hypothetical protein
VPMVLLPAAYASTSSFVILPPGPVGVTWSRGTVNSLASRRTAGDANTSADDLLLPLLLLPALGWVVVLLLGAAAGAASPAALDPPGSWISSRAAPTCKQEGLLSCVHEG